MPITLPKPIADYFAADARDGAAVARCFAETGVVIDERHTHVGREAIRRWKVQAMARYNYVSEPVSVTRDGERVHVTSRVSGDFPGSPIELRYAFALDGGAIARLEIVP